MPKFNKILEALKSFLGIKMPSKVLAEYYEKCPEWLEEGIASVPKERKERNRKALEEYCKRSD